MIQHKNQNPIQSNLNFVLNGPTHDIDLLMKYIKAYNKFGTNLKACSMSSPGLGFR
jgi:hypothetical protein